MKYAVIVARAGPAGSIASAYLAQHGLNILLLDKASFPHDKTCGDAIPVAAFKIESIQFMSLLPKQIE